MEQAGKPYEPEIDRRSIAPLPATASWQDVLQRAFLTNGDIEVAYFDWMAAMARVREAGAYPNTSVSLGYSYLFSKERMKAWDRTTLGSAFDPAMPLQWPGKVEQAAKVALGAPSELPPAWTIPVDDAGLLAVAVNNNAELAALAHDVQGKADALELARMHYIPDISPQFSITGSIEKMLGTMVTLPTNLPKIKGAIEESRALLRSTQAMARQVRSERGEFRGHALFAAEQRTADRAV
ncbi:MAG: TolC family protein [Tepidisphaeraceae bacterium]